MGIFRTSPFSYIWKPNFSLVIYRIYNEKFFYICISSSSFINIRNKNTNIKHNSEKDLFDKNKENNFLIWVYNIIDISLIKGAPFKTKTECAKTLGINRGTVRLYLNSGKLCKNKWIFSYIPLTEKELSKWKIPSKVIEIIIGELLGDGHIRKSRGNIRGEARLEFTFSVKNLQYVKYLKYEALNFVCTDSEPTPWPSSRHGNLEPTQYWFSTKSLPIFSELHNSWYKKINGKYKKVLPINIEKLLTPVGLAHWIMGDGYYNKSGSNVIICTDNFTENEVLKLIEVLDNNFGLKSTKKKRISSKGNLMWRIYISKLSMKKLKELVIPYFIPDMLYKLNIK